MPRKRDRDATHANKLLKLFAKLFFNDRAYALGELAEMLDCSKQTVLRLVDAIEGSLGLDIERGERGPQRTFRLPRQGPVPRARMLVEEEIQALQMCAAFAESLLGREDFDDATRGLEKSSVLLADEPGESAQHFGTLGSGHIDYGPHRDTIRTLIEAMDEARVCVIRYRRLLDDVDRTYRVKPLKIFSYRDAVYLHTRLARQPGKPWKEPPYHPLLAVHRIRDVRTTGTPFRVPDDYDFDREVRAGFGVWQNEPFRVHCAFDGWAAEYVAERRWSPDQQIVRRRDGTIELVFTARGRPEVVAWILGFGARVRVLAPTDLAEEVRQELESAVDVYARGDFDAINRSA